MLRCVHRVKALQKLRIHSRSHLDSVSRGHPEHDSQFRRLRLRQHRPGIPRLVGACLSRGTQTTQAVRGGDACAPAQECSRPTHAHRGCFLSTDTACIPGVVSWDSFRRWSAHWPRTGTTAGCLSAAGTSSRPRYVRGRRRDRARAPQWIQGGVVSGRAASQFCSPDPLRRGRCDCATRSSGCDEGPGWAGVGQAFFGRDQAEAPPDVPIAAGEQCPQWHRMLQRQERLRLPPDGSNETAARVPSAVP